LADRLGYFAPWPVASGAESTFNQQQTLTPDGSNSRWLNIGEHVSAKPTPSPGDDAGGRDRVQDRSLGLSSSDLKGGVSLVNVFASWCIACREEHPVLMRLAAQRSVAIHGLQLQGQAGRHGALCASSPAARTRGGFR
jgi:thiol-disulfide isomerase/thioredoxin